jgi:hypothetical protein
VQDEKIVMTNEPRQRFHDEVITLFYHTMELTHYSGRNFRGYIETPHLLGAFLNPKVIRAGEAFTDSERGAIRRQTEYSLRTDGKNEERRGHESFGNWHVSDWVMRCIERGVSYAEDYVGSGTVDSRHLLLGVLDVPGTRAEAILQQVGGVIQAKERYEEELIKSLEITRRCPQQNSRE